MASIPKDRASCYAHGDEPYCMGNVQGFITSACGHDHNDNMGAIIVHT